MRELTFDGLSPDGSRLVLAGKDGQRYTVAIDERLEAAVRRDRARMSQVELEQAGQLRPREIQARIRAGATAEDVAAASGLPLEHVRRFEGPVLTERAWVAQQAQSTEVRRPGGDIELGDLVVERLHGQGVNPADITWDAWRRDDGLWVVIATFPIPPNTHAATWTYDSGSRTMTVADDNARALSSITADEPLRLVVARPALASVAPLPDDEEAQDAPAAVLASVPRRDEPDDEGAAADEDDQAPEAGDDQVGDESEPASSASHDADDAEAKASEEAGSEEAGSEDHAEPSTDERTGDEPAEAPQGPGADDEAHEAPLFDVPPASHHKASGKPSVPSFDDILFGPGPTP